MNTHHNGDHVGGNRGLLVRWPVPVFGLAPETIPGVTRVLAEGETFSVPRIGLEFSVIDVPGHTAGHIACIGPTAEGGPLVFCGDTLFTAGCGRLFEGTPAQMVDSLSKLAALLADTRVFCGHEYTLANLRFAQAVEPANALLRQPQADAQAKRDPGEPTVPSTIAEERATNPFLRVDGPAVRGRAARRSEARRSRRGIRRGPRLEKRVLSLSQTDLTHSGVGPYHLAILRNLRSALTGATSLAVAAALALALASCATVPKGGPAAVIAAPALLDPTSVEEPAAAPEEPITAAEIAVEPMHPSAPPEPPAELASAGDQDSVTTLQLRSEYGDLWTRIRLGFILDDLDTPLVKKSEDWYAARPDYIARMVERSRRYLYHIVVEVEKRGMPLEIALLPMIESAYNPMAYSRSRASGIWQFIPSTGKSFGMEQNWWLDERRDVIAATDGALDYLQKLHAEFGDWYLALAAYNWGEGSVRRAIAANRKRGQPIDYLSLKMPAETRNYIPKLQAVKNIVSDPERYDLTLADMPDAPYFAVVQTEKKMDVKVAAELAEIPLDEFLSLNPQHNRPVIAGADQTTILLPYDKAEVFAAKLELTYQPMVTWQAYKFRAGETLQQVAVRFGLPLETLRTVNGIGPRAKVPVGHALLVPTQVPSDATVASLQNVVFTAVPSGRTFYHRVRKGETLASIAARYDVSTQDLKGWNKGHASRIVPGQRLRVVSDAGPVRGKKSKPGGKTRAVSAKPAVGKGGGRAKPASAPASRPRHRAAQR